MIKIEVRNLDGTDWYSWCNFPDQDDREYFEAFAAHLTSQSADREYRVAPIPVAASFRADLRLTFDLAAWQAAYGGVPDNASVTTWLTSALFVGSEQVGCQVNWVAGDDE